MDAQTALQIFLDGTLERRRDRYIGFIDKPKTRPKFLRAIYHELEGDLDASRRVKSLPTGDGPIRGYLFAPPDVFGNPIPDIRALEDTLEDSFLAISKNGQFGIHGPEGWMDDRAIYNVKPVRA